jgi:hypothetical protein
VSSDKGGNPGDLSRAWGEFREQTEALRKKIFAHPYAERDDEPRAMYLFEQMQAIAFNRIIAPRGNYPRFYLSGMCEPMTYTMGGASSDMMHRQAFLDGRRRYRIVGRRGTASLQMLQLMTGYWGDPPDGITVRSYAFDEFEFAPDGAFMITASASPMPGNHVLLDPDCRHNCLMFRELFSDWENETLSSAHVEIVDDVAHEPVMPTVDETVEGLRRCIRFMNVFFDEFGPSMIEDTIRRAGVNRFLDSDIMQRTGNTGGSVGTAYYFLAYELPDDGVVIVEMEDPQARYWSFQLTDRWHQTCEPAWHQSSLNSRQIIRDDDGKCRIVLSLTDPGVANWLDPVSNRRGLLEMRVVDGRNAVTPHTVVTRSASLRSALPKSTCWVNAERRKELMSVRRHALLRRWNA